MGYLVWLHDQSAPIQRGRQDGDSRQLETRMSSHDAEPNCNHCGDYNTDNNNGGTLQPRWRQCHRYWRWMFLCAGLLHWTQSRSPDAGKETRRQTWQTQQAWKAWKA